MARGRVGVVELIAVQGATLDFGETVAHSLSRRCKQGKTLVLGEVHVAAPLKQSIGTCLKVQGAGDLPGSGFSGNDIDGSPGGALTKFGALGPTQHFDALDLSQIEPHGERIGQINAIQVNQHTGLGTQVLCGFPAHAADRNHTTSAVVLGDIESRHVAVEIIQLRHSSTFQVLTVYGGDGHRRFLDLHSTVSCGDRDFFQNRFLFLGETLRGAQEQSEHA